MNLELTGSAKILQEQINLDSDCEFNIFCSLEEINRGRIIKVKTKFPGNTIENPYNIPFENYSIKGLDNKIDYSYEVLNLKPPSTLGLKPEVLNKNKTSLPIEVKNMTLKSWKEVFLYSYEMIFNAEIITLGLNNNLNKIVFYIPNLIIGYDEMKIENEIINYSEININYKNNDFKITLEGVSDYNNDYDSIKAQTNFTSKLIITKNDLAVLNYELVEELANDLILLISIAYGSYRPYLKIDGFYENELAFTKIIQKKYTDCSEPVNLLKINYSSILTSFILENINNLEFLEPKTKNNLIDLINDFTELNKFLTKKSFSEFIFMIEKFLSNYYNEFKTSYGVSIPQEEGIGGSAIVTPETPEQSSEVFSNKNKNISFIEGFQKILDEFKVIYNKEAILFLEQNKEKAYSFKDFEILNKNISYLKDLIILLVSKK
ncbi:MAG: hypothetical protein U0457_11395 [Candidatus Sericytochromatia bacterium]